MTARTRSTFAKTSSSTGTTGIVRVAIVAGAALLGVGACSNQDDTRVLPPVVLAMQETLPPVYDDGQVRIYQVSTPVALPLRAPNDGERPQGASPPYPRAPFQLASDTRITVRFTLTNLDDAPHTVELLVDPWNEFVRYVPGFTQDSDDETEPNFSGIDRYFILGPKARVEGILTPDDMVELATDLGTAMQIAKTPPPAGSEFGGPVLYNRAFNVQNRSSEPDPVLAPYIPKTVAGLVGFDAGLRTAEAAKVAVELVVDIEDRNGKRVIQDGDDAKPIGRPGAVLTPPKATGMGL